MKVETKFKEKELKTSDEREKSKETKKTLNIFRIVEYWPSNGIMPNVFLFL